LRAWHEAFLSMSTMRQKEYQATECVLESSQREWSLGAVDVSGQHDERPRCCGLSYSDKDPKTQERGLKPKIDKRGKLGDYELDH
jgi:hypothetical protein